MDLDHREGGAARFTFVLQKADEISPSGRLSLSLRRRVPRSPDIPERSHHHRKRIPRRRYSRIRQTTFYRSPSVRPFSLSRIRSLLMDLMQYSNPCPPRRRSVRPTNPVNLRSWISGDAIRLGESRRSFYRMDGSQSFRMGSTRRRTREFIDA